MREFKSLKPVGLPTDFDTTIQTEEPIVKVKESNQRIKIDYAFPGFYLSDTHHKIRNKNLHFRTPRIKAVGQLMESGKPELPSFGRYVQIPPHSKFTVKVETGNPVRFDNILLSPSQVNLMDGPNDHHELEYDEAFYGEDELYPVQLVEVTGPQQVEEYTALLVHVRPLQFNPAKHQITGFGNITVTIELVPEMDTPPTRYTPNASDRRVYGNLFLNPHKQFDLPPVSTLPLAIHKYEILPPMLKPLIWKSPQMLIVYYDDFKEAASKLMHWKNDKGLRTSIVPISGIGNDPEVLRKYLYGRRAAAYSTLRYVLLLGDVDQIKPHNLQGVVTDYYFGADQNLDPSTLGSQQLLNQWMAVGRIPVRTNAEALEVVDQIITYEKTPPIDLSFYDRMLVAAFDQEGRGYLETMQGVSAFLQSLGYIVTEVYTNGETNPSAPFMSPANATAALIEAASEGQLIIGHRDHGNEEGWYQPPFTISHLRQVTGTMPSVFFSVNCLTGMFDRTASGAPKECFAEANLRLPGTAPSLIAATRVSPTIMNNPLIEALYDAAFSGFLPTFPGSSASYPVRNNRLGDMLNYARTYLPVAVSGAASSVKYEREIYHIVGDPSIEVWVRDPGIIKMRVGIIGTRSFFVNLSSVPVGTVLTIWFDGKLFRRLEPSSVNTTIALPEEAIHPGTIALLRGHTVRVCCYAPGFRFVESTVKVEHLTVVQPVGHLHPVHVP